MNPGADLEPSVIVIFGITGDLAKRKVLPAPYNLMRTKAVHEQTLLVGTSRREVKPQTIVDGLRESLADSSTPLHEPTLQRLISSFTMLQLDPDAADDYTVLADHLDALEDTAGCCLQRLYYLSIPPQVLKGIVTNLGKAGLQNGCRHNTTTSRLLVEKPFGYDSDSARQLIDVMGQYFEEQQIFRIDHYLAKETAQNILTFRRSNPLFTDAWNGKHISRIRVEALEAIGIEGRANFYDQVGALRDLIQSHLLQLLTLVLMDVPTDDDVGSVHNAKQQVLDTLQPVLNDELGSHVVRGQYAGYAEEIGKPTNTETFASLALRSNDPRWENVELHLTTGKALRTKYTGIIVDFGGDGANRLELRIQPHEGISLTFNLKQPGLDNTIQSTTMDFNYEQAFADTPPHDAYERVLVEAIRGDRLLFATDEQVMASWRLLQPVIDDWNRHNDDLVIYQPGSDGPERSDIGI